MTKSTKRSVKAKRLHPKMRAWIGYCILNRFGEPWTDNVFRTSKEAEEHVREFYSRLEQKVDIHKLFSFSRVTITYTVPTKGKA